MPDPALTLLCSAMVLHIRHESISVALRLRERGLGMKARRGASFGPTTLKAMGEAFAGMGADRWKFW